MAYGDLSLTPLPGIAGQFLEAVDDFGSASTARAIDPALRVERRRSWQQDQPGVMTDASDVLSRGR